MQNYIWRRNDSFGGWSNSLGWVTTSASKERMLSYMKDFFERGMMQVFSMDCLEEMKSVVREGGVIAAMGRNKDDRVIASALATAAFAEQVQPRLINQRVTRMTNKPLDNLEPDQIAVGKNVANYLKRIGMYGNA
jgi:hypothetical protein